MTTGIIWNFRKYRFKEIRTITQANVKSILAERT